jgi:hypothetical protein
MAEITLADGAPLEMPLRLRVEKGIAPQLPRELTGRVVVGAPVPLRLAPESAGGDAELARYIEQSASQWTYHLVGLTCTFVPSDDLPLAHAWLQVQLGANGGDAVAHSMEPIRQTDLRELSVTAKIVVPCVLAPELGVSTTVKRENVCLEALYEGTSAPSWSFHATPRIPLRGLVRLRLVTRSPAGAATKGLVSVGATVREGLRPFSYEVELDDLPTPPSFELS